MSSSGLKIGVFTSVRALEITEKGVIGESVGSRYSPMQPCADAAERDAPVRH
jgi:hypothetical protein